MSISVRSYDPHVECEASAGHGPPPASCEQALADMPVDRRNRLFAKSRDGTVLPRPITLLPRRFYRGKSMHNTHS